MALSGLHVLAMLTSASSVTLVVAVAVLLLVSGSSWSPATEAVLVIFFVLAGILERKLAGTFT